MVGSIKNQRATEPYYGGMYLVSINGNRVGFSRTEYIKNGENDTRISSSEVMFFAPDETNLMVSDTTNVLWSNGNGELINQGSATSENGELTSNLSLSPTDGGWQVSGMSAGKELNTSIKSEAVLLSPIGETREIRNLLKTKGDKRTEFFLWVPSIDPGNLIQESIEITGRNRAKAVIGPMTLDLLVSKSGIPKEITSDVGGAEMVLDLVWEDGYPDPKAE